MNRIALLAAFAAFAAGPVAAETVASDSTLAVATIAHHTSGFAHHKLPLNGNVTDIYAYSFKPKTTGVAAVNGRGFCSLMMYNTSNSKEIDLDLHLSTVAAFSSPVSNWGVAHGLVNNGVNAWTSLSWSTNVEFPVRIGNTYKVLLTAMEIGSKTTGSECSGTVTVDIH